MIIDQEFEMFIYCYDCAGHWLWTRKQRRWGRNRDGDGSADLQSARAGRGPRPGHHADHPQQQGAAATTATAGSLMAMIQFIVQQNVKTCD